MSPSCPLCGSANASPYHDDAARAFFRCATCDLVFVPADQHPTPEAEARRYALHENSADDPGYLRHLRRLADPLSERLRPGARGLDFGCGPAPALARILEARGFHVASYDPQFFPDRALLARAYDFVTCSEVIEHVHDPAALLETLDALLGRGGTLAVMTRLRDDVTFATWWYRRDITHVCFYSRATMTWIAGVRGWRLELPAPDVALFVKPARA